MITNKTTMVDPINSFLVGQITRDNSALTSFKNIAIFFILRASWTKFGRPGGIRTPNPQIWSLPLYQFELLTFFYLNKIAL